MSAVVTGRRSRRRSIHYGYVASVSLFVVLSQFKGILPIFRDTLREYLGISIVQYGLLFSAAPLIGVLSVLFGGALVDRFGAVRMIRYCLWGMAGSFMILGMAGRSYGLFMLAICVGALFAGPLFTAKQVYVSQLFPRDKRRALSLSLALISGGGMLIPLIAELLLSWADRLGAPLIMHGPFLLIACLLLAGSTLYRGDVRPRLPSGSVPAHARFTWRAFVITPPVFWLVLLGTFHGVADSTLHVWMPKFLASESFDEHPILPGVVLSGYALAYLIARATLAFTPNRFARRALIVLPGLVGGGLLIAGILSRSFWLTAAGYVAGAFVWSNGYPALLAMVAEQDRRRFGAAIAWMGMLSALLSAAGIASLGAVVDRIGEDRMWMVMIAPAALFVLVGVGGLLWLAWHEAARPAAKAPATIRPSASP